MQVKKFEAATIKEALEMVKTALGPDAIIVQAKENHSGFGLAGRSSVEVTAAVSDYALKKKQIAETRLNDKDREKLLKAPARIQKEFINKVIDGKSPKIAPPPEVKRGVGGTRYADIPDEEAPPLRAVRLKEGQSVQSLLEDMAAPVAPRLATPARQAPLQFVESGGEELAALRQEVSTLREVIKNLQNLQPNGGKTLSVHPGAELGLPFELSAIFEKLREMGLETQLIHRLLTEAQSEIPYLQIKKKALVEGWIAKKILELIQVVADPMRGTVHVFMGPNGQGKTSTVVKMASHLLIERKRRVGIITADTFKVGSADQMKIYAQILNVPFAVVRHASDWNHMRQFFSNVDHLLVDMPGLMLRTVTESDVLSQLLPPPVMGATKHLVLSAATKDAEARAAIHSYSALQPSDLVFTGVDLAVQHGVILNMHLETGLPLQSFGIGPRIPEDWEEASRERLLDLLFRITKTEQRYSHVEP